jgi:hypothetical protein
LFAIAIVRDLALMAERLYQIAPSDDGFLTIDQYYQLIENYDIDKKNP